MVRPSLPAWECGLKSCSTQSLKTTAKVTPCVGVWIEISISATSAHHSKVTPCVGVWIEIKKKKGGGIMARRHSLRGSVD